MKHKQGEQTFYNPEMGLLWPPGDLYGHHSEQEHRASLLACTVTLDCFQLLLEEWTNCIWFLFTLKLTATVRIVMNSPWFQEIFPQNWRVSPQIAAPSPLWPADSIKIDGSLITQTISWNHSLNGLKWSHLTNMGCEAFEMIPHISLSSGEQCPISHFEIYVTFVTLLSYKLEFISSPDCQSDHWFNLAPFVAAPERARWAIRGQNHCNYSTLPVSPGNFLIYKF